VTAIPPLDLRPEVDALWPALTAAIEGVLRSTQFILGPNVKALEAEIAADSGVGHAVGLNSGTDALVIGLRAMGVGPGDEVIAPAFTFFATAEAIDAVGARPVFADVDEDSFNLDPAAVAAAVGPRTRAIMPVHLFGRPADMPALRAIAEPRGIRLLEDAAQAYGADLGGRRVGALGHAAAFSFFPTKNLGAYGDGGMLVTDDAALADRARMLRQHGGKHKYANEILGYNSRLDELQAAILRVKRPHVAAWNDARRRIAARYRAALAGDAGLRCPEDPVGARHVYHQFTIRVLDGRRDAVQRAMADAGIGTMVYYPTPVHRLPVYAERRYAPLPVTERLAGEVLSLPIWPSMDDATVDRVAGAVRAAVGDRRG